MFPYPAGLQSEKAYQTAEGAALASAAALAASSCVLPPQIPLQFNMSAAAYENIPNENVDWAALAAQWIQMRDVPPPVMPQAPPPPMFHTPGVVTRQIFDEQGEAEMEVDSHQNDDPPPNYEGFTSAQGLPWDPPTPTARHPAFNNQPTNPWVNNNNAATMNTVRKGYLTVVDNSSHPPPAPQLSGSDIWAIPPPNQEPRSRFFNPNAPPPLFKASATAGESALLPGGANVSNLQAPTTSHGHPKSGTSLSLLKRSAQTNLGDVDPSSAAETIEDSLDAAKRKNLPAWIREGLEKMEREKLKLTEREKEIRDREEQLQIKKRLESEAMEELKALKRKPPMIESKEVVESDEEDDNAEEEKEEIQREKFAPIEKKSMADIMLLVRQTLTEVLLEVTNEEIKTVAMETRTKFQKKKLKATPKVVKIVGGRNLLTQKLGLAAYGDSSDSESDDDDGSGKSDDETPLKKTDNENHSSIDEDSEDELRETIRRRQQAFKKIAREIEDRLAEEAERAEELQKQQLKRRGSESLGNSTNHNCDPDSDDSASDTKKKRKDKPHKTEGSDNGSGRHHRRPGKTTELGDRNNLNLINVRDDGEPPQTFDKNYSRTIGNRADRKSSRFSDPKDTVRSSHLTHVSVVASLTKILGLPMPSATDGGDGGGDGLKDESSDDATGNEVSLKSRRRHRRDDDDRSSTSSYRRDESSKSQRRRRSRERTSSSQRDKKEDDRHSKRSSKESSTRSRRDSGDRGDRRDKRRSRSRDDDRRRYRSRSRDKDSRDKRRRSRSSERSRR